MKTFFYGWYMKCQSKEHTVAVIPAVHQKDGQKSCSIQLITEEGVWMAKMPDNVFSRDRRGISIGENRFSQRGIRLHLVTSRLDVKGELRFGPLSSLRYDIMGPFGLIPFLECRHRVFSMKHLVTGTLSINGRSYCFDHGWGYWEGDCGYSFPKEYAWTQCCFPRGSLMLSVADIPMAGFHFTGTIAVVMWHGREYRMATYLGAKVIHIQRGRLRIRQGDMELEAWLLEAAHQPLQAPVAGDMGRTIHESAVCRAYYRFRKGNRILFAFETRKASFEYEYAL